MPSTDPTDRAPIDGSAAAAPAAVAARHGFPASQGLYDSAFEHDACGVNFIVHMKGLRSHEIVQHGIGALCNLQHRGAGGVAIHGGAVGGIS